MSAVRTCRLFGAVAACAAAAVLAVEWPAPLSGATAAGQPPAAAACGPLSTRERVMQVVLSGVPDARMNARTRNILEGDAASVVLFADNIAGTAQLRALTRRMRDVAGTRLLVAVDEEGGRVSRLGEAGIVRRLPAARRLAQRRSPSRVRALGAGLGRQMLRVGVDWDLAPVLDVTRARADSVIGDRSYGGSPGKVSRYGRAFARGLASTGVHTAGKHFPGHGRTTTDSHRTLPTVRASRGQLLRRDVAPYVRASGALDAVMSAHVRYTALDRRNPATLSRAASRLLRRHVGFEGVLVTDALEMGAIARRHSPPAAAELAVKRGFDMVLLGQWRDADPTADRLIAAVRRGRLDPARLDEAVARVLRMKGYSSARVDCMLGH